MTASLAMALALVLAQPRLLPEQQVFPGTDGASAATLDTPLAELVAKFVAKRGKKTFAKRIVVHKARRRMDVFADEVLLKSYVVNLGPEPVGTKAWEGDGRTPEGELFICSVNRISQFTRFLALAYPTPADGARGRKAKRLAASDAQAIEAAWKQRDHCPPQTTALGGMVGIHGKGGWLHQGGAFAIDDWTLGCVGLRDVDILELFDGYAERGVPVRIEAD